MARTTPEHIQRNLAAAVDLKRMASIYRQQCFVFGKSNDSGWDSMAGLGESWPTVPDVVAEWQELGVSSMIANAMVRQMAKFCRTLPEPEFPHVDTATAEIRKQFWLARARGSGQADGEWLHVASQAWLEGYGFGRGVVQVGLRTNSSTGQQRVHCRHIPSQQFLTDRSERSAVRARYQACMNYVPMEDAVRMFGRFAKQYAFDLTKLTVDQTARQEDLELCRVIEYYDIGLGGGEPTMAYILGDIGNKDSLVEQQENPFGILPFACYEHLFLSGMRYPVGQAPLLMASQAQMNDLERAISAESKRVGFDIVGDKLSADDLARVQSGQVGMPVRLDQPLVSGDIPYTRVPAGEVSQTTIKAYELGLQEFIRQQGDSELDMGSSVTGAQTLGEVQLVDQRSKQLGNMTLLQTTLFYRRWIEVVMAVAKAGDTDPALLDVTINGKTVNYTVNDPSDPNSALELWLEEPSAVIVGENALTKPDADREKAMKQQQLMSLADLVAAGIVDNTWYAEQRVKAAGFDWDAAKSKGSNPLSNMIPGGGNQPPMPEIPGQQAPV